MTELRVGIAGLGRLGRSMLPTLPTRFPARS